ncbi:MAG: hypothetical protein U0798_04255 [Gemmataceae bacterium]
MRKPTPFRRLFPGLAILMLALSLLMTSEWSVRNRNGAHQPHGGPQPAKPAANHLVPHSLPNVTSSTKQPETNGIHNVYSLASTIYCGSEPEGQTGFHALKRLGVTTVISVDGSVPNVELAEKNGLRYIHLPIGYDGISRERALEIATVISNQPLFGTIYIHCHHGKHRGPAAAVAALRCIDPLLTPDRAESLLKTIGTDPHYAGLYRDVRTSRPFDPSESHGPYRLTSRVAPSSLVERMVAIDGTMDRLKLVGKSGWVVTVDHPDLAPAHEALQLVEHYQELQRLEPKGDAMARHLSSAITDARQLETLLRNGSPRDVIDAAFRPVAARCAQCHTEMRDHKP